MATKDEKETVAPVVKNKGGRPRKKVVVTETQQSQQGMSDIAAAIVKAIDVARPVKKTQFNTHIVTPWSPAGVPRVKHKRKHYHHGLPVESRVSNEEITLLNQLRPGVYCDGYVKVIRRRDKGIDIDYPIKTASQRLRLVNQFGIRSFAELLQRCIAEADNPKQYAAPEDE